MAVECIFAGQLTGPSTILSTTVTNKKWPETKLSFSKPLTSPKKCVDVTSLATAKGMQRIYDMLLTAYMQALYSPYSEEIMLPNKCCYEVILH